ncbi:hypothetical protein PWT90_03916 [Aphanocladium album]|nr:hypothetical protein PWT90_03916 [Aphanocladium album]
MSSTISSSPTDGTQEPPDLTDSRNPSRQTSYHESDVGTYSPPNYIWQTPMVPVNGFPIPHVQSLESIQTALSAHSLLQDTSSLQYYPTYAPLVAGDGTDSFALLQQAGAWTAYTSDTASVDLYHEAHANIHRTDSTLSVEAVKRNARASFPVYPRSRSPLKAEDRVSRSRSIVGVVTPPTDAGVKKSRKEKLRTSSSRRNSMPLVSSGANCKNSVDANGRRTSPSKEEAVSNDEPLSSEDEDSRNRPKSSGKEPTFACPFYRRWPTRHIECMNRKLTRIQDVKQHIYRRHSKSPFYCPTCSKVFASPDPRDEHIREGQCTPATASSKRSSDGISAQVQDSLKNRFSRRLSPIDQWYGIWDLIFPDVTSPENAHVGSLVTEMVGMLKDFWKNEGQCIIPSLTKPNPSQPIGEADLQMLMAQMLDKVQDHFEGEPSKADSAAVEATDSQGDHIMGSSSVEGKSGGVAEDDENSYEQSPPNQWGDNIYYSPDGSPTLNMGGRIVPPCADLGSSGMLVDERYTEQSWMASSVANPIVNRFQ